MPYNEASIKMKKKVLFIISLSAIITVSFTVLSCGSSNSLYKKPGEIFEYGVYNSASGIKLPYRFLRPEDSTATKESPLVIFLHGSGERGTDNEQQLKWGVREFTKKSRRKKFPCYMIVPQCPENKRWVETDWSAASHTMPKEPSPYLQAVYELLKYTRNKNNIDPGRIYITGISMGGFGTWDALQRWPNIFAAAVPVCGGGDSTLAYRIKNIPVRVFHNSGDGVVPVIRSRRMVSAVKKAGGNILYTEYKTRGHNAWTRTYSNDKLYEWMFRCSRK